MTPSSPRFVSVRPFARWCLAAAAGISLGTSVHAQAPAGVPAGNLGQGGNQPAYVVPYHKSTVDEVTEVLGRLRAYLESATPAKIVDRQSGAEITDFSQPNPNAAFERGDGIIFPTVSYEWGVTYAGMLLAAEATGDAKFNDYTSRRLKMLSDALPMVRAQLATAPAPAGAAGGAPGAGGGRGGPGGGRGGLNLRSMIAPGALDDAGSMCAALIKANRAGVGPDLRPVINTYIDWISHKQYRFADGTLARMRPQADTLWLDDLFMSVPALAQMGKLTGERVYFDDAVKQIEQFSTRMFNPQLGVYMHGWSMSAPEHPEFHWARANGWAIMAMVELLDVLPEDHPGRAEVLRQLRAHIKGLASYQAPTGFWHQLLDMPDSYAETSATAIFTYCIAHAVNRGWVSAVAYGPVAQLGWNAVATKVNAKGQVEGTCVGTDLAFDLAYYYYRPVSVTAAHGYGPVLLAGAETLKLLKNDAFNITSAFGVIQFVPKPAKP
jgi:unsaturated rhamnogalacturonyl hydrolase